MRCKWIEAVYPICMDYVIGHERNLQEALDKITLDVYIPVQNNMLYLHIRFSIIIN